MTLMTGKNWFWPQLTGFLQLRGILWTFGVMRFTRTCLRFIATLMSPFIPQRSIKTLHKRLSLPDSNQCNDNKKMIQRIEKTFILFFLGTMVSFCPHIIWRILRIFRAPLNHESCRNLKRYPITTVLRYLIRFTT